MTRLHFVEYSATPGWKLGVNQNLTDHDNVQRTPAAEEILYKQIKTKLKIESKPLDVSDNVKINGHRCKVI